MLDSMWNGLMLLMDWKLAGLMLVAISLGNFFGAVPGLGGNIGLALMIPLVYGMQPFMGIAFLLSMHSVVHTGGSIPGILFGIPGTGPTVATILDGYPMTKQGKAGEAMGAQLAASGLGGIIGALVLAFLIPVLRPIAMTFGSPEIFMLIVFGLTFLVVVSRESISKGFAAAFMGLLVGLVGLDTFSGAGRYTFDQVWLWDGIHIVSVVIGLFAFAEMIDLGARGKGARIAEADVSMPWIQLWDGTMAVFREWWLSLRTALIGAFIGIIPGLGGDVATWICYGHAVQTCKNNQNFGKGDIRGVIGVETANNAKEGGSLLPTIVFGIPGSSGMAIMMGALLILGITPGPKMITEHLDLVWGMVWVMVIANIVGAATLYPLSGYMGRLAFLRGSLLIPPILVLASVGTSLIRSFWQDLVLAIVFSVIGIGMKRWKYPRAPLVLGFILGPLAEDFLNKSLFVFGFGFLRRPVVLVLLIMVVLSLAYSIRQSVRERQAFKKTGRGFIIAAAFMIIFAAAIIPCPNWPARTRLFPLSVSLAGLAISTWIFFAEISRKIGAAKKKERSRAEQFKAQLEKPEQAVTLKSQGIMILWMALYVGLIVFFGFWVAMAVFIPLFMTVFGRESLKTVASFTAGIWLGIYLLFSFFMEIPLYGGLLDLSFF